MPFATSTTSAPTASHTFAISLMKEILVARNALAASFTISAEGTLVRTIGASNSGYHFQLLSAVIEVNELQKRRVVQKLQKHLGKLRGKKIALLGLAFKAGTDDMREAPSLVLASRLLAEGAEVRAWDPVARPGELMKGAVLVDSVLDAVRDADAAVIVTEWNELRDLASKEVRDAMARPLILDGRNLLDPAETRAAGFAYEGIGRPSSPFEALPETAEREIKVSK